MDNPKVTGANELPQECAELRPVWTAVTLGSGRMLTEKRRRG
jgi:hypothetical protein